MTLKRLDLFGFKTFADRTEVELPAGVTCVVGPNGSGKSNISDAILWALGESNVRHLRGDRAQDVIFAGAGKRKPLGMAEASLTFDNHDGRLGMDDPEVTVTRRVYRNGEGEYFINRTPCRLKDIHSIFLDTGIGRDAYNMVNQSDVDAILSARPEERRHLFEEAAGIKKYRVRKNEALRKLESTSGNLLRVSDILAEVDRSVGPLERAAAVAREFRALDERRADLERVVLAFDAARLSAEMEALSDEAGATGAAVEAARAERATAEANEAAARLRLAELERAVEEARARAEQQRAERTRREADRTVLAQRREEAARREAELAEALRTLESRRAAAEHQHTAAAALAEEMAARQRELAEELAHARAASEAERAELEAAAKRLTSLRAQDTHLRTTIAARAEEARAARADADNAGPALGTLAERQKATADRRRDAEQAVAEAEARLADAHGQQEAAQAQRAEAEARRAAVDAAIREAESRMGVVRREAAGLAARRRALAEMAEQHEGFYAGVRAVLQAGRRGDLSPDLRAVADVIQAPAGLETAIETALGGQLQDVICPTDREAKDAIAYLKRQNAGRATFLPLDLLRPSSRVAVRPTPGVIGWAADLVTCDPEYARAVEMLLGRVLVVEDLDTAVALVRRERLPIRVVSRDGEVVSGQGSITGGRGKGTQSHLLARRREMRDLAEQIAAAEAEAAALDSRIAEQRTERAEAEGAAREAAASLNDLRLHAAEATRQRQYAETEAQRLGREAAGLETESRAITERAAQRRRQAAALEAEIAEMRERLAPLVAEMESLQTVSAGPDEDRRAALMTLEVEAASVRERKNGAETERNRAEETIRVTRDEIVQRTEQRAQALRVAGESVTVDAALEETLAQLAGGIEAATTALNEHRAARDAVLTEAAALRERAHAAEERASAALERLRKVEARLAGLGGERGHVLLRLREILWPAADAETDAEMEPEDDGEEPQAAAVTDAQAAELLVEVDIPVDFSRHAAVIELNRLKRAIAALGPVNLAAEEEHRQAAERQGFLRMQKDDLVNAEETLRRAIREIDESTKDTFLNTFHTVEEQFGQMFRRLFGGGVTRLELTDPDDLLETGIDIIVQPPGKRLQNLQLLSGGERALTAAALMFAFLRVKPSPFVVLDEVDAPLDEANVGRFAAVLREFSEHSQFIVITHNRGTMEAADALYGVTMREPGISSLVSLRLEEKPEPAAPNGAGRLASLAS